jgi:hypothetical protein
MMRAFMEGAASPPSSSVVISSSVPPPSTECAADEVEGRRAEMAEELHELVTHMRASFSAGEDDNC